MGAGMMSSDEYRKARFLTADKLPKSDALIRYNGHEIYHEGRKGKTTQGKGIIRAGA